MKGKMIFGALLVSVALCGQGFGFELLDRMLGLNGGGCGDCKACAKVACCDPAVKACCPEPACCEKPTVCDGTCGKCKKCRPTPVRDLFAGMLDLFECKAVVCNGGNGCEAAKACDPACCEKPQVCDPACCEKPNCCKVKKCRKHCCQEKACCDPACCEKACCEPTCKQKCHKLYRRPVLELLDFLFGGKNCCQNGCEAGCTTCGTVAPAPKGPSAAPEAAPLPQAPKADPSAALPSRGIYQAARSLVRN